ncbi:hypothetical protein ABZ318_15555 [Streptomyces sp. NPDC006197]|uniref:hypothetical protein n=1 Tax=Streptomyces sp. NPDC006197 TaxID=3156685 RepID=UPI0033B33A35
MNVETVAEWTRMLEQLAAEDQAVAVEAADRRQRLERELAQAREHEELVVCIARHSRDALDKTSKWLERLMAAADSARECLNGAGAAPAGGEMGSVLPSAPELVPLVVDGQEK